MRPHGPQSEDIVQPQPGTDRCAPRHENLTACVQQLIGDDKILGGVGKDLKAILAQDTGGFDQPENIGLQGIFFANDL